MVFCFLKIYNQTVKGAPNKKEQIEDIFDTKKCYLVVAQVAQDH
jgi:hypothetical protein